MGKGPNIETGELIEGADCDHDLPFCKGLDAGGFLGLPCAVATIAHTTCNLCEAMCGLSVTVEAGRVKSIEGDKEDVFSRGHICPKGPAMRELLEDPDRVRRPLRKRECRTFKEVSCDSTLSEAAEKIAQLQKAHGNDSVGVYWGNPVVHDHGTVLMSQVLGLILGTRNKFDSNSADANPKLFACDRMYGDMTSITVPDIDNTDYFLMIGANPLASGGSVMSLGDVRGRVKGIVERGGKLVVVDPRRTETAQVASVHIPIVPGTDAAFLLGLLHVLFSRGFVDETAVENVATGLAELRAAVSPFSPERVSKFTGVDAATITRTAIDFGSAKKAVAYSRIGVCHGKFSALASYLVEAVNLVTGNFDRQGGSMFPSPAIDLSAVARALSVGGSGRFTSRVRGLPEVGGMLPCATLADEMEGPGQGQIRGLVTLAGNPVLSVPNGDRIGRLLPKLNFMVSIDVYINETTRHAQLILPPRPALARGHYDLVLHAVAVRNTAKWSEPVVLPDPDTKDDWEILQLLSKEIARARGGVSKAAAAALDRFGNMSSEKAIDLLLRLGPYGDNFVPWRKGLTLKKLKASPHGVDLGPLAPGRLRKVHKPNHKADLAAHDMLGDLRRLENEMSRAREGLLLIGRRHVRSNNTWMHNCHSLVKGPDRSALMVNPLDAAKTGLKDGENAFLTSQTGEIMTKVKVTDEVMPGVVSLPHGYGHGQAKDTLRIAGNLAGPSMNSLTDDNVVEPLTGSAVLTGIAVTIKPV
ncbi:MAG: molybdopterin-dependent oxidoreductase [Polyangiaceae bacterium]|nr:molybdopterin-dependent oxidoreductase [Polyangiaceae bacterium]